MRTIIHDCTPDLAELAVLKLFVKQTKGLRRCYVIEYIKFIQEGLNIYVCMKDVKL